VATDASALAPGRVPETYRRVVEAARQLFGASAAFLYRVDASGGPLTVLAAVDRTGPLAGPWPAAALGEDDFTRIAVRSREPTWTGDFLADHRLDPGLRAAGDRLGTRSALAAPLVADDRVMGLLVLHGATPGVFGAAHRERVRAFAEHAAATLELAHRAEDLEAVIEQNTGLVAALTASEARYRAVVDTQTELIYRCHPDGTLTFANEAYCRYFGLTPEAVTGRSCFDPIVPEDRRLVRRQLDALTPDRPIATVSSRVTSASGEVRWLQCTLQALFAGAGRVTEFQAVGRDVTDQKRLEERVLESQKMDAVAQLARGIAHEFNNLLTVVMGGSHLLLADLEEGDPRRNHAEAIARAADEAAELVRRLVAFARWEPVAGRRLEPDRVLAGMAGVLRGIVREDIALSLRPGAAGAEVVGAADQIEQVVLNVVLNACDAMPRGGRLEIATAPAVAGAGGSGVPEDLPPGRYVALTVRDTGEGMTPEVQARAFEPFFTTKGRGGRRGRGLGLAVVYGIVRQSGGRIGVESAPGQGTTVTLYLPRVDEAPAPAAGRGSTEGR